MTFHLWGNCPFKRAVGVYDIAYDEQLEIYPDDLYYY